MGWADLRRSGLTRALTVSGVQWVWLRFGILAWCLFLNPSQPSSVASLAQADQLISEIGVGVRWTLCLFPLVSMALAFVFFAAVVVLEKVGVDPHCLEEAIYYGVRDQNDRG